MGDTRASSFKRDLNSLESGSRKVGALSIVEAAGLRPATRGVAVYVPPASTGVSGGGIASPLTEPDYAMRSYWDYKTLTSQDGLLTFYVQPIKQLAMEDADTAEVIFNFDEPTA